MKTDHPANLAESTPRERILATALRLFYQEGIRATGVDRVIAESSVSKVTFYRHFPSKNDLILAYLEQRHRQWMDWFSAALDRRRPLGAGALPETLREWFDADDFRGCAFINSAGELPTEEAILELARRHKAEMRAAIANILPESCDQTGLAAALALAVDGAIVQAQREGNGEAALDALSKLVCALPPLAA
ncbi:TetR/AcrR family transcriptional regulator [Chromobacterium sp. IIBBL 290-4]|uniref:TetR/AcrR family transcriptional regulator n=1 Tax=Chromobacterium sp. IIBBL 290-4 TaxID=2953890 RepID=UPI0020B6DADA|nr:TetR/AcrR family transcriptional regulator [Chromobacterium sp. IIBBL 290-4]UTH73555.1 TetR/AcrR family transcriptional regulator [Chromobacterium sp. IIBBL 290-4]